MNFTTLTQLVIKWAKERDLVHEKNVPFQMMTVTEEIGELAAAVSRKNRDETIDAIGDSFVTLIILSAQLGLNPKDCLLSAYTEIHDRKGKTVDGTFIKDEE